MKRTDKRRAGSSRPTKGYHNLVEADRIRRPIVAAAWVLHNFTQALSVNRWYNVVETRRCI
jgi:hypothetical protein